MSLIHVNICSHARPLGLVGVVMALNRLRSGAHEVRFRIGIDEDDQVSLDACSNLSAECAIDVSVGPRPVARGEIENRLLKGSTDADVVTMLTDRTFCITPSWDDGLALGAKEQPKRLLWWTCPHDNGCVMPIIPRAWREAADNVWSPEIFPFWFDDTWNQQIDLMLYGMPSLKVTTNYTGTRAKTKRAQDFAFWIQLFNHLLPLRIEQAKVMGERLDVSLVHREDVMKYIDAHYTALMQNIPTLEKHFADSDPPGPEYAVAKQRAEKLYAELIAGQPREAA